MSASEIGFLALVVFCFTGFAAAIAYASIVASGNKKN
jgi:hypothetical protein